MEQKISYENITDQYNQNKTLIENSKSLRNTYLLLLQNQNLHIDEILKIKKELNIISGESDSLMEKKKNYDDWLGFSPVTIEISEIKYVENSRKQSILKSILTGFSQMFYLFFDTISFLIASLGVIVPVFFLGYFIYKYYKKKYFKQNIKIKK